MIRSFGAIDRNYKHINPALNQDLRSCSGDKYGIHIIPFSNNPNKFYIVQFQSNTADLYAAQSGLQVRCPNAIGLGYSVFDLTLNNGLGDFSSINTVLRNGIPDKITLIRHANGYDTWVIVHGWGNNTFYAYLFTDAGVSAPVTTNIGPVISGTAADSYGEMCSSHDGSRIIASSAQQPGKELYNFDKATGILSNYQTLQLGSNAFRFIFSPDDTKLYFLGNYLMPGIFQLNMTSPNILSSLFKVASDNQTNYYDMQVAPDGKIYANRYSTFVGNNYQDYLSVINCPNLPKWGCNFDVKGFPLGVRGGGQFPVFINDFIQQPDAPPITEFSLGNDTAICFGSRVLSAPPGWQSYKWSTGDTTRQINVTTPGDYSVLAGDLGFSCPSAFGGIKLTNAAQPLNLGRDTVVCPKSSVTIQVPANFNNILWNDGSTLRTRTITTSGVYSVKAQDQNGCTNWDTISVGIRSDPRANFHGDTVLCNNQKMLLQLYPQFSPFYNPAPIYLWQNGSNKDTLTVTQPGQYWGKVTYSGCTITDTINVSYVNAENISLGADTSVCTGDSLRIGVTMPGATFQWNTGATTPFIVVNNSGTYILRVNNGTCTIADTIKVTFQPKPLIDLGNDTTVCQGESFTLHATVLNSTYLWQDGSIRDTMKVAQPGLYWVKVTRAGCSTKDSITVFHKPIPVVNLGGDTTICNSATYTINAFHPSVQTYLWQDGSTQSTFNVTQAGTYSVTASGVNGCIKKDTVIISYKPLPVFNLGPDTLLCEGQQLLLTVPLPNTTFTWNTGNSSNNQLINQPGIYWLDAASQGCTKRDSIVVLYKPLPLVDLGNDTKLCEGTSKLLNANNSNAVYLWQDGSTQSAFLVTRPGTFHVKVDKNNCIKSDTITINFKYKPVFTLGNDTSLCTGQTIRLDPHIKDVSYLWQDQSTSPTFLVSTTGLYSLKATNSCGDFTDKISITKGLCSVYMPTAFTPNNDGLNDIFKVKYREFIKEFSMRIYNRFGQLIFETNNVLRGWDGKFKGLFQPVGTYTWQIHVVTKDGQVDNIKGLVELLR